MDRETEIQEKLKVAMRKEIAMMREVLANMHQEELTLQLYDQATWTRVLQDRGALIERLSALRKERLEATQEIQQLSPLSSESECEIFSMRDQLMALIERINSQQTKNQLLYERGIKLGISASVKPSFAPQPLQGLKRKGSSLATYPERE